MTGASTSSTVPPMTVCVIGAGSSGIAAAKALAEHGIPFDCFEASDRVGGNWVFKNRNGMSSSYRSLHINTSRERMEYSDFPMPATYPDFPHHTHIAAYFDDYVDHFGLRDRITFETLVTRAERREDGRWDVTTEPGGTRSYDALIVANGHHWDPRWPEPAFPGHDVFAGVQMHSHFYTGEDPALFRDRDVVVLGMGNSAMDIAVESSFVARNTYLAARRGAWVIPKYLFGRPKPDHPFGAAHPTVSDDILSRIAHGEIAPKPNIAELTERTVRFTDGSEVDADVVVYCTGYKVTFPFLDAELVSAPDNDLPLFRRVFHPEIPNLYFVGLLQPLGAIMPLAEIQSQWICDHLAGRYTLPAPPELRADMEAERRAMFKRYVPSKRHTMQVDFEDYVLGVTQERKRGAAR